MIEITTYHMLGDTRSPWDWAWVAMVCGPDKAVKVSRFGQPSGNQPGIVKHMWSKLDDSIFHPRGEWSRVHVAWNPPRIRRQAGGERAGQMRPGIPGW